MERRAKPTRRVLREALLAGPPAGTTDAACAPPLPTLRHTCVMMMRAFAMRQRLAISAATNDSAMETAAQPASTVPRKAATASAESGMSMATASPAHEWRRWRHAVDAGKRGNRQVGGPKQPSPSGCSAARWATRRRDSAHRASDPGRAGRVLCARCAWPAGRKSSCAARRAPPRWPTRQPGGRGPALHGGTGLGQACQRDAQALPCRRTPPYLSARTQQC
jgi:hypothetical protein